MLTIEIDTVDRLCQLVNELERYSFLLQLVSEYKDYYIYEDKSKEIIRSSEYFLIENNLESVKN